METIEKTTFWPESLAKETRLWMRYLHFRPWFENSNFVDLDPQNSFGARYGSLLANQATIVQSKHSSVPTQAYDRFCVASADGFEWDSADFVFAFGELKTAVSIGSTTNGKAVIGAEKSPDLTFDMFKTTIKSKFDGKPIQFLTQSTEFPYRLTEGTDGDAFFALIGAEELPKWPTIGFAMPTVDSPHEVREAILSYIRSYPGEIEFAVVANGSSAGTLASLHQTAEAFPVAVTILEQSSNIGYGQGANRGMEFLLEKGGFDLLGVTNDDVLADVDCLGEMIAAYQKLEEMGANPGVIGPVSNQIHGPQCVELKPFSNFIELQESTFRYRLENASSVTQTRQLRGLLMLISPKLIDAIGGFDPIYGIGNFEDDDHNLRTHLAGFTIWIADGAFLYHHGSTTFRRLDVDYQANIHRNAESMAIKWRLERIEDWISLNQAPEGAELNVPLSSWKDRANRIEVAINGESVDLVSQASDVEFAAWIIRELRHSPRATRKQIIDAIKLAA